MDDCLGPALGIGLLFLVLLPVVAIYAGFVLVALAIAVIVAALSALVKYVSSYAGQSLELAISGTTPLVDPEPAGRGYFFGPGFTEAATARKTAAANIAPIPGWFVNPGDHSAWVVAFYIAWRIGGAVGCVVGGLLAYVWMWLSHLIVLGIGWAVSSFGGVWLRTAHRLWDLVFRIKRPCPNPECWRPNQVPIYVCPSCGAEHRRLWPNSLGVLRHVCACGASLPAVATLGKRRLAALCPVCRRPVRETETRPVHLAFAGGPSSGKSNLMFMALAQMIDGYSDRSIRKIELIDETLTPAIQAEIQRLKRGDPVSKTADNLPKAIHLKIDRKMAVDASLYVYDVAGEAFLTGEETVRQSYYGHVDGVLFIVDPLSIPDVRSRYEEEQSDQSVPAGSSELEPQEAYGRLKRALYAHASRDGERIDSARLAVTISKADLLGLHQTLVDDPPATPIAARGADAGASASAAPVKTASEKCRQWLEDHGQGNLLRLMEADFSAVSYFAVSALGRTPQADDSTPFSGSRVLEPITWALADCLRLDGGEPHA